MKLMRLIFVFVTSFVFFAHAMEMVLEQEQPAVGLGNSRKPGLAELLNPYMHDQMRAPGVRNLLRQAKLNSEFDDLNELDNEDSENYQICEPIILSREAQSKDVRQFVRNYWKGALVKKTLLVLNSGAEDNQNRDRQDIPCGLVNPNNRCFLNSALQLFAAVPELRQELANAAIDPRPESMAHLLKALLDEMRMRDASVIDAKDFEAKVHHELFLVEEVFSELLALIGQKIKFEVGPVQEKIEQAGIPHAECEQIVVTELNRQLGIDLELDLEFKRAILDALQVEDFEDSKSALCKAASQWKEAIIEAPLRRNFDLYRQKELSEEQFWQAVVAQIAQHSQIDLSGPELQGQVFTALVKLTDEARPQQDPLEFYSRFFGNYLFKKSAPLANLFGIRTAAVDRYMNETYVRESESLVGTFDIGLPLEKKTQDLEDIFALEFTRTEELKVTLPEESSNAGNKAVVLRKNCLAVTGDYFLFNLKRLQHGARNDNPLSFPLTQFDLKNYFVNPELSQGTYELIGVKMHGGSAYGGHYISYIRGVVDGKLTWFLLNDASVTPLSDLEMMRIAIRGYGRSRAFLPTTFLFKRSAHNAPALQIPIPANAVLLIASNEDGKPALFTELRDELPAATRDLKVQVEKLLLNGADDDPYYWVAPAVVAILAVIVVAAVIAHNKAETAEFDDEQLFSDEFDGAQLAGDTGGLDLFAPSPQGLTQLSIS